MIKLNNGVMMPQMAAGTWQYDNATAQSAVTLALDKAGFTHIDTAENYYNQIGVGKALAGRDRSSYFLTTKTVPCDKSVIGTPGACFKQTLADVETDLKLLGVDYVDLILLHGPARAKAGYGKGTCDPVACASDAEQWAAYEQIYKAGKAKAIGVSNYCQSCLDSLLSNATVVPAVNQVSRLEV
jgi:diketogulonate reductase-like aldo/keto reductase